MFANEIVEVFGEKSTLKNGLVEIKDAVLIDKEKIVSGKKLFYDKNRSIVSIFGNVYINYDKYDYILSNRVIINLNENRVIAEPLFLFNYKDKSWINSVFADNKNSFYQAKKSVASTCSVNKPDWKLVASSLNYDKKSKWINLYNPILYLKGIPILYLPYLGFSLDKSRSSGFLRPIFGFSDDEGFLFTIPYYQTLGVSADIELDPTIRSKRGKGIYSVLRFVHSPTSYGEFKIGSFRDYNNYSEKYNLANRTHRGWSFLYKNYNIFSDDELYISLKNANDTEYFYLDAYNKNFTKDSDKILTSNINYYFMKDYNYFGIYGKYFKDTSKISNDDTMQVLPQLHYHYFNYNFWNNFSFSIDSNFYNYYRKEGYKVTKKTLLFPLHYNISFFEDYLKFSVTEQLNMVEVTKNRDTTSKLSRMDTFVKLYSNLSKKYSNFSHHLAFSLTFGMDNFIKYNQIESDYLNNSVIKKSVALNLSQYLSSKNWSINHNLSEVYYIDDKNVTSYSDLLNYFDIRYKNYYLKESNRYDLNHNQLKYNSIALGFDDNYKGVELIHSYQKDNSESITFNSYWKFDKIHKIFWKYNYDIDLDLVKYNLIGISMKKRCWNYSISYKKEIVPLLTNDGISSIIQKTIYFEIELVPLGGIDQQYQIKKTKG